MATNYSSVLKLALPTAGELSGTWGDTVNQSITNMVEEAIAGIATISTWTTNAHTLAAIPNGATGPSRAAALLLTDPSTQLTGAGTLNILSITKIYAVINTTAYDITVKPSGTGVSVVAGGSAIVVCDGTNAYAVGSNSFTTLIADNYVETVVTDSGSTFNVDVQQANIFEYTLTGNTTFTFSNAPAAGKATSVTLILKPTATVTITWPASVKWSGGLAPDPTANGTTDVISFMTYDGGVSWFGFVSGVALA